MNIQLCPDSTGLAFARRANALYDFNKVVLAANGNYGGSDFTEYCNFTSQTSTVASPAMAHKVLGVGAVSTLDGLTAPYQGLGPTKPYTNLDQGGRFKPDLQAPTDMTTANATSDTAMSNFNGTSAATPFATAVAALWDRLLLRGNGATYSTILATGNKTNQGTANTTGTGLIKSRDSTTPDIMVDSTSNVSGILQTTLKSGDVVEYTVTTTKPTLWFRTVLWWPEDYGIAHNDLDLVVIAPNGQSYSSSSAASVWELVGDENQIPAGTWKIQVKGFSIPRSGQTYDWTLIRGE